ncbi:MAG: ATP-dependent zinc metalloprotease FtsH [Erysipelothrix sp.]|nr:ATP-dependent zinc metalloprotease FtsH [Erysipelothrix sp.]
MLMSLVMVLTMVSLLSNKTPKSISINDFEKIVETNKLKETVISPRYNVINISGAYEKDGTVQFYEVRYPFSESKINELTEILVEKDSKLVISDPFEANFFTDIILPFIPYVFIFGFMFMMMSRSGGGNNKAFSFGESKAKIQGNIKVRFSDVAGAEEEKEEMQELIDYLKYPKKFEKMGARIPKGMLLVGPPGTGKTLLARAAAGEADVPFYSIAGSDFVEMFIGVGASRVRDMFKKAKATAPCIIFIDEIDAVGRQRGAGLGGGNDEREQTLNQLLVEMDGIDENSGVLIIAATNRDDVLDPALLRPGRFDRKVTVGLPDIRGREAILKVHARNKKLADDTELHNLAKRTPGFSGADLENVLNEAAILAVRDESGAIEMHHLDEAIDRVIAGPAKKSKKYSEKEKYMVAVHEVGHTIIGLKLESANMVQKVTIIPRGDAGGYNLMTPREEKFTQSRSDLIGMITGYLGGRVAEEIVFDEISTGAFADIQSATKIARSMVTVYGMSNLGPIQYENPQGSVFLGRDYHMEKNHSGEIGFEIDKEVRRIIDEAYEAAKVLILEHRALLDSLVEALLEHETLTSEQIRRVVEGKDPFSDDKVVDVEITEEITEEKTED